MDSGSTKSPPFTDKVLKLITRIVYDFEIIAPTVSFPQICDACGSMITSIDRGAPEHRGCSAKSNLENSAPSRHR
jgi:hypothetical protein